MSPQSRREYMASIRHRYATASRRAKARILDEVCATTGYHRKYAIQVLTQAPAAPARRRCRAPIYSSRTISVLTAMWEAAGYPWSARLKALVPLWLPWAQRRWRIPPSTVRQLLTISPRTIDRRLQTRKRQHRRRLYGRTKPGTLLKHHIPIKTTHWEVTTPGFTRGDLVAHSGPAADGDVLHSLTVTDIHSTWVETRAVFKSQTAVVDAVEEMAQARRSLSVVWTPTTGRNSLIATSSSTASSTASSSRAAGRTRKMTTPTSSKRTGPTSANSSAGIDMSRLRRRRRSTTFTATSSGG